MLAGGMSVAPATAQDVDPQSLLGTWRATVDRFETRLVIRSISPGGRVEAHWDINGKGDSGEQRGSIEGDRMTLTSSKASGSYRYTGSVSMRDGVPYWEGTWKHPVIKEWHGSFTAHLVKPAVRRSPQGGVGTSATLVMCDRDLLAVTDDAHLECTAMVTDASGQPGSTAPTGDVAWTTNVGTLAPAGCTLTRSGGSTSWCAVTLTARAGEIPLGTAPPVTASYPGDETFGPSEGSPELYGAAGNYDSTDLYGPGCNPAAGPYPAFDCGDPVNPATGNLVMVGVDLAVGGRGPGLGVQRTYDSLAAAAGESGRFGAGWYDLYGARIRIAGKRRTVVLPGGQTVPFRASGKGFRAPGWVTATLTQDSSGAFRLRLADGTGYRFDQRGRMTAMTDAAGEAVTLTYATDGRLAKATDGSGRAITFATDPKGRVTSATDPAGRTVRYGYSPTGDLASVTGVAGDTTRYVYDERHRLMSVTDPLGATATNAYDDLDRVVRQVDPAGGVLGFAYRGAFPDVVTLATDATGIRTGYEFQHGLPISVTEAIDAVEPSVTRYRYDDQSRPIAVFDADHQLWSSIRSKAGDIVASTDPLGRTTALAWDGAHRLLTTTSPLGIITRVERNRLGLATRLVDAVGTPVEGTTILTYGDSHHPADLTSVTDQVGSTTTFTYDDAGSLATATDALGGTTSFIHDVLGQMLSVTDPAGASSSVTRDVRGDIVSATDALSATTTATWDARGALSSRTDALGRVTSFQRDVVGRAVQLLAADGASQAVVWDAVGARTTQTDALGSVTTTKYDDHGRPASWTDANGGVWRRTYDPVGRVLTSTDPGGVVTRYAWDAGGQLMGLSYSDGTTPVAWTYDADGRRATMTDATGTSTYIWDARGRPVATTDGAGRTVRYAWDPASRLVGLTYPDGSVVERSFDALGRLVSVSDGAGRTSTFGYDAAGNLVDEHLGNGVITTLGWDAVGRLSSIDSALGRSRLWSFGSQRDASGAFTSLLEDGAATAVGQDEVGRLARMGTESFGFDSAGNLTSLRGGTLGYGAGGRLASTTSNAATTTYDFDASGRRTSATSGTTTARYGYDGAGRLTEVTDPSTGSEATWTYDGDGLRVGVADAGAGVDAAFTWGHGTGGIELLDDGAVRYVYGPGGVPLEQVMRDGTATWIHTDLTGSVRGLTDQGGAVVATLAWDAYGLPTRSTGNATTRLGFQGHWTDPGTGLQYLQVRVYDPATGQFLTIDPAVTSTHHAYAFGAGDPLVFSDPTGTDPIPAVRPRLDTKGNTRDYALAGHGNWDSGNGYTTVPKGTTIIFYGPQGSPISDDLGVQIEANKVKQHYREVYGPGDRVRDYTLGPPVGLTILPKSATVNQEMRLSQLLKPGQGSLRWAACRSASNGPTDGPIWHTGGMVIGTGRRDRDPPLGDPAWFDWDSGQFSRGV